MIPAHDGTSEVTGENCQGSASAEGIGCIIPNEICCDCSADPWVV